MATQPRPDANKADLEREAEALRLGMPVPPKIRVVREGASLRWWRDKNGATA